MQNLFFYAMHCWFSIRTRTEISLIFVRSTCSNWLGSFREKNKRIHPESFNGKCSSCRVYCGFCRGCWNFLVQDTRLPAIECVKFNKCEKSCFFQHCNPKFCQFFSNSFYRPPFLWCGVQLSAVGLWHLSWTVGIQL